MTLAGDKTWFLHFLIVIPGNQTVNLREVNNTHAVRIYLSDFMIQQQQQQQQYYQ